MGDTVAKLAADLLAPASRRDRYLLGVVGPPGSGKSTLAASLAAACGVTVPTRIVALDGFHLPNAALDAAGTRSRKGAPHTFDAPAFIAALEAIRRGESVCIPRYDRTIHEPVTGGGDDANAIDADTRLVIVEGNYLLLDMPPWHRIAPLLDATWYLDVPVETCLTRVRARHIAGGLAVADADVKIDRNDRPNAQLIASTRGRADRILTPPWKGGAGAGTNE